MRARRDPSHARHIGRWKYDYIIISKVWKRNAAAKCGQLWTTLYYYLWATHRPAPTFRPPRISHSISSQLIPNFAHSIYYSSLARSTCFFVKKHSKKEDKWVLCYTCWVWSPFLMELSAQWHHTSWPDSVASRSLSQCLLNMSGIRKLLSIYLVLHIHLVHWCYSSRKVWLLINAWWTEVVAERSWKWLMWHYVTGRKVGAGRCVGQRSRDSIQPPWSKHIRMKKVLIGHTSLFLIPFIQHALSRSSITLVPHLH